MAYVIAEPCIGTKDNSCVEVCPVDCIHPTQDEPDYDKVEMLYIDPEECIDCEAFGRQLNFGFLGITTQNNESKRTMDLGVHRPFFR